MDLDHLPANDNDDAASRRGLVDGPASPCDDTTAESAQPHPSSSRPPGELIELRLYGAMDTRHTADSTRPPVSDSPKGPAVPTMDRHHTAQRADHIDDIVRQPPAPPTDPPPDTAAPAEPSRPRGALLAAYGGYPPPGHWRRVSKRRLE